MTLMWSSSAVKEEICCAEGTSCQNPDWQGPLFPFCLSLYLSLCVDGNLTVKSSNLLFVTNPIVQSRELGSIAKL